MNLINQCAQFVWSVLSKRTGFKFSVYIDFGHSFCGMCPLVLKSHYFHSLPDSGSFLKMLQRFES